MFTQGHPQNSMTADEIEGRGYSQRPIEYLNPLVRGNYALQQQHNNAQLLQQGVPRMSYSPHRKPPANRPPAAHHPHKNGGNNIPNNSSTANNNDGFTTYRPKGRKTISEQTNGPRFRQQMGKSQETHGGGGGIHRNNYFSSSGGRGHTNQNSNMQQRDNSAETAQTASKAPLSNSIPHVVSSLEELYRCPVCLEIFENPYTLPCQHPLCKECLDVLVQIDGGMTIKCPLCNAIHLLDKDISCLKAPLTMKQTVECLKANRSPTQAKQVCMEAGCKRDVVTYCVNSKTYLCKPCKSDNDRFFPDSQRYQSVKYSMNQDMVAPFCHIHESFETHCCKMCTELCCIYCYVSKHKNHNVVLLNEYNTHNFKINHEKLEELQNVETNLESNEKVSQSYKVDLRSDADAMKKVIKLNTKKIMKECLAMANHLEVQLLNVVDAHQTEQCELLNKYVSENHFDMAKLSNVFEEVGQYKKKSQMERFYHYFEMKDIIENIYQEQAFGKKSDDRPSKPSFEVYNPSHDSDLVLAEMKDKFELIFDKLLAQI